MIKTNKSINIWMKAMTFFSDHWGCHQMPERSFFIKGYQFPLCSRCTGILVGEIVSIVAFLYGLTFSFLLYLCLGIPAGIDGIVQFKTAYESNNIKRIITGFLLGYGMIGCILTIIAKVINMFT